MDGEIEALMLKEFSQLQKLSMVQNGLWETLKLREADWVYPKEGVAWDVIVRRK